MPFDSHYPPAWLQIDEIAGWGTADELSVTVRDVPRVPRSARMRLVGRWTTYGLTATRPRVAAVARLGARLRRVGLDGVLADLDRPLEPCPVPGAAAGNGFTWSESDRDDPTWWPQGVAAIGSGEVLLVSWYAKRRGLLRTGGSRISVVDRRSPDGPRYRHVLLVAPRRPLGLLTMGAVSVHAGGITVCGDLLYVADTLFGVRVFRLGDAMRVTADAPGPEDEEPARTGRLRRLAGGFDTRGHDYLLPQLMALRVPLRAGRRRLRYSFLSTGEVEGRPSLVVGEYRRKGGSPRLARYALDPSTGLPVADDRGRTAPLEVHEAQPDRMQGAAAHGSTWFLTASAGKGVAGDLYVGAPGAWVRHRRVLPPGPEDVAWSLPGEELWCVTEWPGSRWLFPVRTGRWRPEAGDAAS